MLLLIPRSLCALKRVAAKADHPRFAATQGIRIALACGMYRAEATDGRRAALVQGMVPTEEPPWPAFKEMTGPDKKRLAISVEEHPIDCFHFEGLSGKGTMGPQLSWFWTPGPTMCPASPTVTKASRASAVQTDVQKILGQHFKHILDFPREYGDYWNPANKGGGDMLEQLADVLADADLKPSNCIPIDVSVEPGIRLLASYSTGHSPQEYAGLKVLGAEGVVLKRRRALYAKQLRTGVESRDWFKRRFVWY